MAESVEGFNVTLKGVDHTEGWVTTQQQLDNVLEAHRLQSGTQFVSWHDDKARKPEAVGRLLWTHKDLSITGPAFALGRHVIRQCQYGKGHKRAKTQKQQVPNLHDYAQSSRHYLQRSKKVGCSAKIIIRYITVYTEYDASGIWEKDRRRTNLMEDLKKQLATDASYKEPLDMYCRKCCLTETSECHWIQCDSCPKWFHLSCLDNTGHTNLAEIQANPYLCKFCLKEYEDENYMLACRNTCQLRVNPQKKRKRSSFVYEPVKKANLDNIKKSMEGEKSAPPPLLQTNKRRRICRTENNDFLEEKPLQTDRSKEESIMPPLEFPKYVSDADQRDQEGMINLADIKKHSQQIHNRMREIVKTQASRKSISRNCNLNPEWLSRHSQFIMNGQADDWKNKGYGLSFFNQPVQHSLEQWIERGFYVDIGTCIFTKWGSIKGASKELQDRMTQSPYEADSYIKTVLGKECLAVTVEMVKKMPYLNADEDCSQTSATTMRKVFQKKIGKK
ncbi:uncharacterized protein LOC110440589 isoform X1 [Mizuhopecten yessoensis]|uniref:PHD-type domain-containing protein n=1 Tax=Mizuhopecten yessoensis TaxID=6573 RepID=A0A210PKX9_MIZYE|nr:uncharacterized protein LOC110440589 isoform X1 [Mizuhopecten yessoensis]XP_021339410.1 uncharacterized protein LOC110440589 isoform X1 [Mizuhopecten yessoensis]OWF37086.1 hypothetical protein KP79_PYT09776 [Mizuhopecten yessoensis]